MVSLFAMVPLIPTLNYKDTTVKKIIATGLLAFGSYGLGTTSKTLLAWLYKPHNWIAEIVGIVFFGIFILMSAYGVLCTIGYLHRG